jgi:protein disulfide-isomerase-like protein
MSSNLRSAIFFSCLVFLGYSAGWWESGISQDLTTENFDKIVGKDKIVVIEFYAQWCRFCREMQPTWDKLAEHYMGEKPTRKDVVIAKLDGGVHSAIGIRYGVQSYPSLLIFKKGEMFPADRYLKERTFDHLKEWVERIAGPEVQEQPKEKEVVVQAKPVKKIESSGDVDEHIYMIHDKINGLERSLEGAHSEKRHNELKEILNEMHSKIDKKMGSSSSDINFSQGLGFMIFGALLGVGISFTYINYEKLGRKRLAD